MPLLKKSRSSRNSTPSASQSRVVTQHQQAVRQQTFQPSQASGDPTGPWYEETTRFAQILKQCGVRLTNLLEQASELSQDPAKIVDAVTKFYENTADKQTFIDFFTSGFEKYIRTPLRLQMAAMPTSFPPEAFESDCQLVGPSESVIRLLLRVEPLQAKIAEMLLRKLASFLGTGDLSNFPEYHQLPEVIVNQFRYLETVRNGEEICLHFLDIFPFCGKSLKVEILSCIPQLIVDGQHAENIMGRLTDLLESEQSIIDTVLETICNLPLSAETLISLQGRIAQSFPAYPFEVKVAALKFLLKTAETTGNIDEIFLRIRSLDIALYFDEAEQQNEFTQRKEPANSRKTMAVLVANALKGSLEWNKLMGDAALRMETNSCRKGDKDKFMDFLIAVILVDAKRTRSVFALIRQKVRNRCWDEKFLDECFQQPEVLDIYFESIMSIADHLIRAAEKEQANFGACLYHRAFITLDKTRKQEVIAALVAHVNSGNEDLANLALATLDQLSLSREIIEFEIVLQGLLDMLSTLKLYQIRKIFALFGQLAAFCEEGALSPLDDLHIFLRKNIHCDVLRQKAIGMLAALTLYRQVAVRNGTRDQAMALYEIAANGARYNDSLRVLFYDELSSAIHNGTMLDQKLLNQIKEELFHILEKHFIEDEIDPRLWKRLASDGALIGTVSHSEPTLSLKILQNGQDGKNAKNTDGSPAILPSLLRLFLACQWSLHGNFDEMDLLLNCPIILRLRDNWSRIGNLQPADQELTCLELLQSGNCIVELMNAMSRLELSAASKKALIGRLNDLISCEREFYTCLEKVDSFSMPTSEDGLDTGPVKFSRKPSVTQVASKKRKTTKKASKSSGTANSNQQTLCTDIISQAVSQQSFAIGNSEEPGTSRQSNPAKASPSVGKFFRDLDASFVKMFDCPLVCKTTREPNAPDSTALTPSNATYLLENLSEKLSKLPASLTSGRRNSLTGHQFGKQSTAHPLDSEVVNALKKQLLMSIPQIWKHMKTCLDYFKETAEQNDGIVDSLAIRDGDSAAIATCVELCVKCISDYLTWLKDNEKSLLPQIFASLGSDGLVDQEDYLNAQITSAVDSMLQYAAYIPTLPVAASLLRGADVIVELGNEMVEKKLEISEIADGYLKREWNLEDKENSSPGASNNALASLLELSLFASTASEKLHKIERRIEMIVLFSKPDGEAETTYKCLTKNTLYTWYRTSFTALVATTKDTPPLQNNNVEAWLVCWVEVARSFRFIVKVVQISSSRQMLAAALRYSTPIFQLLMTKAVPGLEKKLKQIDVKAAQRFLNMVQHTARYLHDICVHAKINTDRVLMKFVPPLKRILEAFPYRVKAMLALNNCADAVTIGMLKNRDLDGETVASQIGSSQSTNAEVESDGEQEGQDQDANGEQEDDDTGLMLDSGDEQTNDDADEMESEDGSGTGTVDDDMSEAF